MPLAFLGSFSQLKSCMDIKASLFPGPSLKEVEVEFTDNIFPAFWWKHLDITSLVSVEPAQPFPLVPKP